MQWKVLKVKISEVKGTKAPIVDIPDFSDDKDLAPKEESVQVEVASGTDEGKEGQ